MFDTHVSRYALLAENYAQMFNAESHHLGEAELDSLLAHFEHSNMLSKVASGRYGLTEHGGAIWEAERTPDWSSYCVASEGWEGDKLTSLEITAGSRNLGERYLQLAMDCGIYQGVEVAGLSSTDPDEPRIYWKPGLRLWQANVKLRRTDAHQSVDLERFNRGVESWSQIGELKSLPRAG